MLNEALHHGKKALTATVAHRGQHRLCNGFLIYISHSCPFAFRQRGLCRVHVAASQPDLHLPEPRLIHSIGPAISRDPFSRPPAPTLRSSAHLRHQRLKARTDGPRRDFPRCEQRSFANRTLVSPDSVKSSPSIQLEQRGGIRPSDLQTVCFADAGAVEPVRCVVNVLELP